MAIPAQGFTVTWGGARLSGVQKLSIGPAQQDTQGSELGRDGTPPVDGGVVRLSSFEPIEKPKTSTPLNREAIADRLTIECMGIVEGGRYRDPKVKFPRDIVYPPWTGVANTTSLRRITLLDHICKFQGSNLSAETNDVIRFDHTFTILKVAKDT